MNPLDRMANAKVIQYRPKYARSQKGGANNHITDYEKIILPASTIFLREADESDGKARAMIQVFGHQASDQAGGNVVVDMWSFWCDVRDLRQGDLFRLFMNPDTQDMFPASGTGQVYNFVLPFFVRAEDFTVYPNTGNITSFARVFGIGVSPPEGYDQEQ